MADRTKGELFSRLPDGTPTDAWIMDELLGEDDFDEGDYAHVIPTDLNHRDKLALLLGGEGSGNFGHAGRKGEVGGSAPDKDGSSDSGGKNAVKKEAVGMVTFSDTLPKPIATRVLGDTTPEALAAQMLDDVPGNLTVQWGAVASDDGFFARANVPDEEKNSVVMTVTREGDTADDPDNPDDDEQALEISRAFTRLKDGRLIVRHNAFKVPEGEQGHGLAKSFMRNSLASYQQMGVDEIRTQANLRVGGYAWAKFGFKAQSPKLMAQNLAKRVTQMEYGGKLSVAEAIGLQRVLTTYSNDPSLPFHIANTRTADGKHIGKDLLVGASWAASLSLKDQESLDRLTHYIKE